LPRKQSRKGGPLFRKKQQTIILPLITTKPNGNNKLNYIKIIKHLLILASVTLLPLFAQPIFAQDNEVIKEYLEQFVADFPLKD